ncbi:MAG: hypothetical protein JSS99_00650 [Actinobacteria bacterium]|nr:hypothetical protein [Actinomycetota bacterium]
MVAHEHRTAAGLFALLVLAYLWPALLPGHALAPTALLQLEVPWAASAPAGAAHYVNGDLADVPLSYYPWTVLARAFVHAGTFPAWNPYAFGGTPLFANLQMAWASPFSVPLWLLPLPYAFGVAAALKLWVAAFGTYLLVRELRLGFWAGVVSGVSFALCAFDVVWLSHGVFVSVAALLPWSIWLTERVVRRGRGTDGLGLALVVAIALTGGHPGTQAHLLAATALYALVRVALGAGGGAGGRSARARLARLGLVGAALLVGALVTAVLLLPGEQAAQGTVGALARRHGSPGFFSSTLTPGALRSALFPDWWGRPSERFTGGPAAYRERTFYAGAVALVLAALALAARGGWRRKAPFALLGVLGAAVALRTPGLWDLVIRLPVFEWIQNGRALLLFMFAVAVLAGFGVQALVDATVPRQRVLAVLAVALLAGLVGIASLPPGGDALGGALAEMVRRGRAASTPAAVALASVGWWLVLAGATGAVALAAVRHAERRRLLGGALALLAALDMLHFAHAFQPMGPTRTIVPGRTPAIAFLQRHAGDGRIAGVAARPEDWTLPADWSATYGLRDIRGYDQPYPTQRYFRLWRVLDPTSVTPYQLASLSPGAARVLGVLGARYLVAPPRTQLGLPHLDVAYDGRDARVFANELAMPRAIVARRVHVASDEDGEAAAIGAASFDPRRDAVVRREQMPRAAGALGAGGGSVRVVAERNARVTLRATLPRAGLVVLGDQWAPGWRVAVDGRPARAVQADMLLRGVVVPAGAHEIVWSYRVPGLRAGAALSALGLLAALAWAAALALRASSRRAARSRAL